MSHLDFYCRICGSKNCTASHVAMRVKNDDPKPDNHDDPVNHPSHYKLFPDLEAIDVIERTLTPEEFKGYCKGNCLKYRLRAGEKGNAAQDLAKSNWYRDRIRGRG